MQISPTISLSQIPSLLFPPKSPSIQPLHKIQLPCPSPNISTDNIQRPSAIKRSGLLSTIDRAIQEEEEQRRARREEVNEKGVEIEGHVIQGFSVGGLETCVVVPTLNAAFGIGRCTSTAVHQDFLFVTDAHVDHIGGLPLYVATRHLCGLKPPTVFVPPCIKEDVENLFDIHRALSQKELNLDLVALNVGETYEMRNDLVVRPFKTHHVIPSQGYVIYKVRNKVNVEYTNLKGNQIKELKLSGVEITDTTLSPEVAFTGDTMSDFILDPRNEDVLRAKVLITEATFLDEELDIKHARQLGHTHLFEILEHAERIHNKALLLTHFSSRYKLEDIRQAVAMLQTKLSTKVVALTKGFKSMYK
ncbi:ribonuclease Z, chloroplastic [Cinnamomum micranthum f. kanehirae]|uniref:Ribonuclease Z, chloroplastic n=1 Tax=Cinnamomum micranthum f. kanehirae TaxID=337451 RepID=A0A443PWJ1_9MAGN|nr:ribonuclease Z, chloroplastic [Cinnamomum micranthum f. kanehirae]